MFGRVRVVVLLVTPVIRVAVSGGRRFPATYLIWHALSAFAGTLPDGTALVVVHGQADPYAAGTGRKLSWAAALELGDADQAALTGADWHAGRWVRYQRTAHGLTSVAADPHPADWSMGRRAGPVRNAAMADAGAARWLAFLTAGEPNAGTMSAAGFAHRRSIPVRFWCDRCGGNLAGSETPCAGHSAGPAERWAKLTGGRTRA